LSAIEILTIEAEKEARRLRGETFQLEAETESLEVETGKE
jgi:hypothetical protein